MHLLEKLENSIGYEYFNDDLASLINILHQPLTSHDEQPNANAIVILNKLDA